MKLFLLGTLLFSGGTAAAMQNEEVRENVTEAYNHVRQQVAKRVKANSFESLRENGFPYPSEERLAQFTEEEQVAILTTIDQINASYDWANMSDDEIKETLEIVQAELVVLADELGIDLSENFLREGFQKRVSKRTHDVLKNRVYTNIKENGIEYPNDTQMERYTEEQQAEIIAVVDRLNATYDWANMTDEELKEALIVVREEISLLKQSFRIDALRLNGLDYPSDEKLANLTEDEQAVILAKIDALNATYDWANMTDEEIVNALEVVKAEMEAVRVELGLTPPHKGARHDRTPQESNEETEGNDVV